MLNLDLEAFPLAAGSNFVSTPLSKIRHTMKSLIQRHSMFEDIGYTFRNSDLPRTTQLILYASNFVDWAKILSVITIGILMGFTL